jgi:hypothetical protein
MKQSHFKKIANPGKPPPVARPEQGDIAARHAIRDMEVGDCLEFDRTARQMLCKIAYARNAYGWQRKYVVRRWSEFTCRVWRLS